MPSPIPESDADRALLRRLLARAADPWTRLEDLAETLGVGRPAVSQYLSGARGVGWHVVVGALRRTARRHPDAVPGLVEALAGELLDARGRWVPEEDGPPGAWEDESADVAVAHGRLVEAVRLGDSSEVAARARALIRESEEAARAATATGRAA